MIFHKPSTRTRVSFESAAWTLGMLPSVLRADELQLGRGETVADTARTLSLYLDAITVRTFAQASVEELAAAASIPVINALTNEHHPCQALADVMTIEEEFGTLAGIQVAFVGDGDNVCALAHPGGRPRPASSSGSPRRRATSRTRRSSRPHARAATATGGSIVLTHDPAEAVRRRRGRLRGRLDVDGQGGRG